MHNVDKILRKYAIDVDILIRILNNYYRQIIY